MVPQKPNKELNFMGTWDCNDGTTAQIAKQYSVMWLGFIYICGYKIISVWDMQGNHLSDPRLNLKVRWLPGNENRKAPKEEEVLFPTKW